MPTDYNQYQDPGVRVEEITLPTVANPTISPTVIALIGDSQRFRVNTEVVPLSGTSALGLSKLGIDKSTIVVNDRYTGVAYTASTPLDSGSPSTVADFRVLQGSGKDGIKGGANAPDDTTTIQRESGSTIPDGGLVTVSYRYTDPNFYAVTQFFDYASVRDAYGDPFDSSGNVKSPLSLAASIAFVNGADQLICVAVQAAGATPTTNEWSVTIAKLVNEPAINLIVPLDGTQAIHDLAFQHVVQMESQQILRRAVIGRDGTGTAVTPQTLQAQAKGYASPRVCLVGPAVVTIDNTVNNPTKEIGGQYLAAALAGNLASRPAQIPLTHKLVFGFTGVPNQAIQKDILESQRQGVCWVYQNRDGNILVKHGVTTKTMREGPVFGTVYTQEISIQASKDRLRDLVRSTLENSDLIGGVLTSTTPDAVIAAITNALEVAVDSGLIFDYGDIQWRQPASTPTMIQVQFSYRPTLPLNYIQVQFSIDTTQGDVTSSDNLAGTDVTTPALA